jgi:ribosomal protein L16 Arg81 hydroxylase
MGNSWEHWMREGKSMSIADFMPGNSLIKAQASRFDLERVLHPVKTANFLEDYWEKQPLLLAREDAGYYDSLFSLRDLDYIISSTDLRFPAVRMVKEGQSIPLARFAEDVAWGNDVYQGTIIPEKFYLEYREGASAVFQALHRAWQPLALFCRHLEKFFHHHVQTNVYLTPKAAQGFKPHYDTHDVFILQIAGQKHWRVYEPPLTLPHRSQPPDNARLRNDPGNLVMEFELKAGDLLYLPRGFVHEALTSKSESLHITVGITAFTYIELINEVMNGAIQSLKQEAAFRRSLPVGFTGEEEVSGELKERLIELVTDHLRQSDLGRVAYQLQQRFINNRGALLEGYLLDLPRLDDLRRDQCVRQRPGNVYCLKQEADQILLEFHGKAVTFPDYVEPSLRFILAQEESTFRIEEIQGSLDDRGKIVLARRLVLEGFLKLVDG